MLEQLQGAYSGSGAALSQQGQAQEEGQAGEAHAQPQQVEGLVDQDTQSLRGQAHQRDGQVEEQRQQEEEEEEAGEDSRGSPEGTEQARPGMASVQATPAAPGARPRGFPFTLVPGPDGSPLMLASPMFMHPMLAGSPGGIPSALWVAPSARWSALGSPGPAPIFDLDPSLFGLVAAQDGEQEGADLGFWEGGQWGAAGNEAGREGEGDAAVGRAGDAEGEGEDEAREVSSEEEEAGWASGAMRGFSSNSFSFASARTTRETESMGGAAAPLAAAGGSSPSAGGNPRGKPPLAR